MAMPASQWVVIHMGGFLHYGILFHSMPSTYIATISWPWNLPHSHMACHQNECWLLYVYIRVQHFVQVADRHWIVSEFTGAVSHRLARFTVSWDVNEPQ